jgi:hypothetical protein
MDDKPAPRVPEPLFPVLRRLGVADVQKARAWLLAWLLDRLGQRVQEPPPPAFRVQRKISGQWVTVAGPFYRAWVAVQIAREFRNMQPRWHYRVVGPDTTILITGWVPSNEGGDTSTAPAE